jgi:hypothetical protein
MKGRETKRTHVLLVSLCASSTVLNTAPYRSNSFLTSSEGSSPGYEKISAGKVVYSRFRRTLSVTRTREKVSCGEHERASEGQFRGW